MHGRNLSQVRVMVAAIALFQDLGDGVHKSVNFTGVAPIRLGRAVPDGVVERLAEAGAQLGGNFHRIIIPQNGGEILVRGGFEQAKKWRRLRRHFHFAKTRKT